jgi:glycosyltransferase involved in cell wall biosynthesis
VSAAAPLSSHDVSAIVCTYNSIVSIEACLKSLRSAGVGQLIVVDASSTDGTRDIAARYADLLLTDPRVGLGAARNLGIQHAQSPLVLNVGSDNVVPKSALLQMISCLQESDVIGVGAQTRVPRDSYVSSCLDAWWTTRFRPGPSDVIGTPSLMRGDLLRLEPFSTERAFSDDEELCTRWRRIFGGRFEISDAEVLELGKTSLHEVLIRCLMYGASDFEVYQAGRRAGWSVRRRSRSLTHPLRVDLILPLNRLGFAESLWRAPFFMLFALARYWGWLTAARRGRALR